MKKMLGMTVGVLCLAASIGAHATNVAELIVRGTIKPVACNLSLTGGGIVDYQTIPAASLSPTQFTSLAPKTVNLNISCGQTPAQFRVALSDLQSASKVPGILGAGFTEAQNYGLGIANGKRTGGYSVTLKNLQSSSGALNPIMRSSQGAAWGSSDGKVAQSPAQYSWRSGTTAVPAFITSLTGMLEVKAVINRTNDLDLTRDVTLDGRTSLSVDYI
ncbi:membrane protein [Pseudomonas sp. CYM-20-01]|jgi:hypothetical protein|uniref:DUF1120 domain-containing protein n=1 Tax=Pseudomonas sp. CYM-20-01 TaxID=2870750 RepID=UPI00205502F1|nr:DUF1120 domain-containing protein [Pseudomonas sp. CYM-20-01]BDB22622.1 membrane protein [Pseudomonas sp. CYM-20-01]